MLDDRLGVLVKGDEPLLDHGLGQKVENGGQGDKLARLHDGGKVLASLRAGGNLLSQEISGGQMGEAVLSHDLVTLGALAAAGAAEDPDDGEARGGEGGAVNWHV